MVDLDKVLRGTNPRVSHTQVGPSPSTYPNGRYAIFTT